MKLFSLIILLLSSQVYAHEHCCKGHSYADKIGQILGLAPSIVSLVWNGGEIANHALGYFGVGEQPHEHENEHGGQTMAQYWHGVEIALHGANLVSSGLDLTGHHVTSNKVSVMLTAINAIGAFAQVQTAISRETSWAGILMAPFSTLDFFGHVSSAWSSSKPLRNLIAGI